MVIGFLMSTKMTGFMFLQPMNWHGNERLTVVQFGCIMYTYTEKQGAKND